MSQRILRPLAVVSAVIAFLALFNFYLRSPLDVSLRADSRTLTRGFYGLERNSEQIFRWTGPHAAIALPGIDRSIDWRVTLDVRVWRPPRVPMPEVRVGVDGSTVSQQLVRSDAVLSVTAPRRAGQDGVTITIDTAPAFAPGPRDTRQLGVAVASIALEPIDGAPRVPARATVIGAAAVAMLAATVATLRMAPLWVAVFGGVVAWGEAALLARGFGPYQEYPSHVLLVAACLCAALLASVWSIHKRRKQPLSTTAIGAGAICLAACFLKLLMLLHPDMPIGDGVFHAHRFEYVLAGRLYFTSLTPDNYAFPYPVFLYVAASPFAWLTADTLDRVALLRIVATVADAAAAALLYWMIVRATSDRLAGIASVVWYHAIPVTAWMMTEGALTNVFAQSLFVASLALVVGLPVERTRRATVAGLTIIAAAALLTHPSTCAILFGVLAATSALYARYGGTLRPAAFGVAIAAFAAAAIAIVVYYAWFPSVYASELGRIASTSVPGGSAHAASFSTRFDRAVRLADIYFGWPAIVAATVGAWRLYTEKPSPALNLLLVAWGGICLVFLAVGMLTPVEMRYHFAAFPALAIAAAFACSWAWRTRHPAIRVAVSAVLLAGVWDGVSQWTWAMTTYANLVR